MNRVGGSTFVRTLPVSFRAELNLAFRASVESQRGMAMNGSLSISPGDTLLYTVQYSTIDKMVCWDGILRGVDPVDDYVKLAPAGTLYRAGVRSSSSM